MIMKASRCKIPLGFTLIETLITVAIIAILFALISPFLAQKRQKAEAAGCMANLKKIYLAETLYAAEHNGRLAPGQGEDPAQPGNGLYEDNYFGSLAPYLERTFLAGYGQIEVFSPNIRPWRCPGDRRPWKYPKKDYINWDYDSSYGLNTPGFFSDIPGLPGWPFLGVQLGSIKHPSSIVLFSETGRNNPYNPDEVTKSTWSPSSLAWGRHGATLNVLYADGHIEAKTATQLIQSGGNENSIWDF